MTENSVMYFHISPTRGVVGGAGQNDNVILFIWYSKFDYYTFVQTKLIF